MSTPSFPETGIPGGPRNLGLGRLFLHHWKDWVFVVILLAIEIALQVIHPYKRYIGAPMFVTGQLRYPLVKETIPAIAVPFIAILIPAVFVLFFFVWKRMSRDLHHSILGLLTAVLLTACITDALKNGLGYPRPDFYSRCFGSPTAAAVYRTDGNVQCTGSAADLKEGYRAFPSGHSSWSFAGLGYLSMYLAGKLGFFDRRGHTWKLLPVVVPLLFAAFVAITRIDNYRHAWYDTFVGALLGLVVSYFCYRQHYPSLFDSEAAATPFPYVDTDQRATTLPASNPGYGPQYANGS